MTYTHNFTDDARANGEIKNKKWIDLLSDGDSMRDLKDAVAQKWFLDNDIKSRLVLRFYDPGSE